MLGDEGMAVAYNYQEFLTIPGPGEYIFSFQTPDALIRLWFDLHDLSLNFPPFTRYYDCNIMTN